MMLKCLWIYFPHKAGPKAGVRHHCQSIIRIKNGGLNFINAIDTENNKFSLRSFKAFGLLMINLCTADVINKLLSSE